MNYIYYQTKTKFINTGDVLINKALLDSLRNYGHLRCNCSNEIPEHFIKELGINRDEKIEAKGELKFVLDVIKQKIKSKQNDKIYVVSGLGHHFGNSRKKIIRNLISGLIIFPIYRLFGIQIIRIGFSIGPVSKKLGISEKIRSIFINHYYVRDKKSLELCNKYRITKTKICPDMSWIYLEKNSRKINKTKNIIVCLRNSMFDSEDIEYEKNLVMKLDLLLKKISSKEKNIKVIFSYQVEEDCEFTKKLYKKYKYVYNCALVKEQIRLSSAEEIYGNAYINISNRMHSILLSYKYGALPIVLTDLEQHSKITQTLIDNNFENIGIDIYNNNNNIDFLLDNHDKILNYMFSIEKEKQEEINVILNKIFN